MLLTPLGELMDQWELHKQFLGIAKPKREFSLRISYRKASKECWMAESFGVKMGVEGEKEF